MPRQSAVVREQVTYRNPVCCDRVVQPEFRNIIANKLCPIETSLVGQHREARGRERLGDRANCKLGVGCRRQSSFGVALTVSFENDGLAVVYDRNRNSGHLPFRHGLFGEGVERGCNVGQDRFVRCWIGHSKFSEMLGRPVLRNSQVVHPASGHEIPRSVLLQYVTLGWCHCNPSFGRSALALLTKPEPHGAQKQKWRIPSLRSGTSPLWPGWKTRFRWRMVFDVPQARASRGR
jgi:hypothetical protein